MIDEEASNGIFDSIDALYDCLATFDEGSKLAMLACWHMNGFEFIHGRHSRELEGIVAIGLPFDVGPFPSVLVG